MRKYLIISLILILGVSLYSQNMPSLNQQDINIEKFKKNLGLTEDQTTKIKSMMNDSVEQVNKIRIDIQRLNLDLREELIKDKPDLAKIKTIIDKKSSLQGEVEMLLIKRDLDIKSVLTPDQIEKWKIQWRNGAKGPNNRMKKNK
jgi:Spy/CpxP family protein refolding chaperone